MNDVDEIETLAFAAGILQRKQHLATSNHLLQLATDVVLKQDREAQRACMSRLETAFKKGRSK